MPSPYDQYDLILTQRDSSNTHFQEVRIADVPNTVLSFDGSSTLRTLAYSENDDSGSLIRRDSSGDAAIGSRLYFTDASANNGTTALIGINSSTARDFAIYDYATGGGYLFNIYSGSKNVQIYGALIQSGSTRIDANGNGYFNNISASGINYDYIQLEPTNVSALTNMTASRIYVSGSTNDLYFEQNDGDYRNVTRLKWLEGNLYTGLLYGGLLTTGSSTTFNISAGEGVVVDLNALTTREPHPTITDVKWNAFTNQSLTYRTTHIQTYIGIDRNGAIVQQPNPFTYDQFNDTILLGTIIHQNLSTINAKITYPNVAYGYKQRTYDFVKAFGPLKLSGLNIVTSGSYGLTVTSGEAFAEGRAYEVDPNHPSHVNDPGTSVSKIFRYYQSGSSFVQDTNGGLGYDGIDPTLYNPDGSGSLIAVGGGYTVQRVFWYPNSATKGIVVYYGNALYSTIREALDNYNIEKFLETDNTKQNAVFLGSIIVKGNTDFTANNHQIIPSGLFRSIAGSGGGGGGTIVTNLTDLNDVVITTPSAQQPLVYNHITDTWVNSSSITANLTGSISGNAATATTASFVSPSGNAFIQNGNSFGVTATIGTNDTHSLHLETSGSTRVAITPSGLVGVNTISPSYTLEVNGTFAANTKSFKINHPTKDGYKLVYGSLESPYHGVRLTGRGTAVRGNGRVDLPEYISKLVHTDDVNIQLTNIKHGRVLFVDEVNINNNYFTVGYDKAMFDGDKTFEFYWDFTAERKDIDKLSTEVKV
jgi:hypothetical protein